MKQRQVPQEKGTKVPAYIVTFSDMVTLLLTFFVMLLSLAQVQDPELYNTGRDSFLKSLKSFGVGILFGGVEKPYFGNVKVKYFISRPDRLFEGRSINAKEEEIRRVFKKMSRSMNIMPSQIVAQKSNFSVTDVRFGAGEASLNEVAKRFLTEFCLDLQQDPDSKAVALCVLGLAGDEATEKKRWILSAKRAQAVADFLRDNAGSQWPIYSWGAGPGGDWVEQDSLVSTQSQILIAVLRGDE